MKELMLNRIFVKTSNNEIVQKEIVLDMFCCDSLAKDFILSTKYHSGYISCAWCCTEGDYYKNKVCFIDLNYLKRTNNSFQNKIQKEHHTGDPMSILLDLTNINIIKDFFYRFHVYFVFWHRK